MNPTLDDWRTSVDRVAQVIGDPCTTASVPGGVISDRVFDSAAEAGLKFLFTCEPWLIPGRWRQCVVFGSVCPKRGWSLRQVERLARFDWFAWTNAVVASRMRVGMREMLP